MPSPKPPAGLGQVGAALFRDVMSRYELLPTERQMLLAACRTANELARLEKALKGGQTMVAGSKGQRRVNPLFAEVRAHRLALRQLLAAIGIEEVSGDQLPGLEDVGARLDRSHAGRQLARKRWSRRGAA